MPSIVNKWHELGHKSQHNGKKLIYTSYHSLYSDASKLFFHMGVITKQENINIYIAVGCALVSYTGECKQTPFGNR